MSFFIKVLTRPMLTACGKLVEGGKMRKLTKWQHFTKPGARETDIHVTQNALPYPHAVPMPVRRRLALSQQTSGQLGSAFGRLLVALCLHDDKCSIGLRNGSIDAININ